MGRGGAGGVFEGAVKRFACAPHFPLAAAHRPPKGGILTIPASFVVTLAIFSASVRIAPLGEMPRGSEGAVLRQRGRKKGHKII